MIQRREASQPLRRLYQGLDALANPERYLFTPSDMRALVPEISSEAYRALLSRAAKEGKLARICRGLYFYRPAKPTAGLLLFHAAARLRAHEFNYISLETALSDAGIISQVPINWITLMSSGRSNLIKCDQWGTLEFVHTAQKAETLADQLSYDSRCRMWRAKPALAIRDMKTAKRNLDLIDWSIANEFV
jgi:predicted transcriptional regulator of viral defense system